MAEQVELVGLDEVRLLIKELPQHSFHVVKTSIAKSIFNVHGKVSSFSGGLNSRSGRLRRSLTTKLSGSRLADLSGKVNTDSKYAPIHETGGTIRAIDKYLGVTGGPYLNIPLSSNKTPAGVMRENARQVFNSGGYIIKSKSGKYLVMSGTGRPMFVLVKQVFIKARLGMVKAAENEVPTLLGSIKDELLKGLV